MPRWRASSRRSRPNEQHAKPIERKTRHEPTCSLHRALLQPKASSLDDWIPEPYGVRDQGWISLNGCQPNRVQASEPILDSFVTCSLRFFGPIPSVGLGLAYLIGLLEFDFKSLAKLAHCSE